jgi:hypothetical protein
MAERGSARAGAPGAVEPAPWTFLTNHAHVLLCIAAEPELRLRDVAARVGVTERAAQRMVTDLVDAGYLERTRDGRRNRYRVVRNGHLRHPREQHVRIGRLLDAVPFRTD